MAQRWKKFEKWRDVKTPVAVSEVDSLLRAVFQERLRVASGTSHAYHVDVSELVEYPKFQFGLLTIPLSGGQEVKAPYLQKAYEAAVLLSLYPPKDINDDEQDD